MRHEEGNPWPNLKPFQFYIQRSWHRAHRLHNEWSADMNLFAGIITKWKFRQSFYEKTYDDNTKKLRIQPEIKYILLNYVQDMSKRLFQLEKLLEMLKDNLNYGYFVPCVKAYGLPENIFQLIAQWKKISARINLKLYAEQEDRFLEDKIYGALLIAQKWQADQEENKTNITLGF